MSDFEKEVLKDLAAALLYDVAKWFTMTMWQKARERLGETHEPTKAKHLGHRH